MIVNRKRSASESDVEQKNKRRSLPTRPNIGVSFQTSSLASFDVEDVPGNFLADNDHLVTPKARISPQNDPVFDTRSHLLAEPSLSPIGNSRLEAGFLLADNGALRPKPRTHFLLDKSTPREQHQAPSIAGLHAPRPTRRGVASCSSSPVLTQEQQEEEPQLPPPLEESDTPVESIEGAELKTAGDCPVTGQSRSSDLSKSSLRKLQRLLSVQVSDTRGNSAGGSLAEWASIMSPIKKKQSATGQNQASRKRLGSDSLAHARSLSHTSGAGESSASKTGSNITSGDLNSAALFTRGVFQFDDQLPHAAPKNLDTILQVLDRKRDSLPPTPQQAAMFKYCLRHALNEDSVKEQAPQLIPTVDLHAAVSDFFKLAPKMQWKDGEALCPLVTPGLSPPEPDYCISIDRLKFPVLAIESMKGYATPADGTMAFPIFNIEVKGPDGKSNGAMFQNMQSCSVAVNNILELRKRLERTKEFYGMAHVVSGILTERMFELHVHWAVLNGNGQDIFYNREIAVWALRKTADEEYIAARRAIRNILDWQKAGIGEELVKDMKDLEIQVLMPPPPTPTSPP